MQAIPECLAQSTLESLSQVKTPVQAMRAAISPRCQARGCASSLLLKRRPTVLTVGKNSLLAKIVRWPEAPLGFLAAHSFSFHRSLHSQKITLRLPSFLQGGEGIPGTSEKSSLL
jgi:hypothetical protein